MFFVSVYLCVYYALFYIVALSYPWKDSILLLRVSEQANSMLKLLVHFNPARSVKTVARTKS